MVLRIGVFGGTFDPVHLGHLVVAEEARVQLDLDQVIFVPAGQPRLRSAPIATSRQRFEMARLAVADNPRFRASDLELLRGGPSYTVDTLMEFRRELPADSQLYFVLGRDALAQFSDWKSPDEVLQLCNLVAVSRPDWPEPDLTPVRTKYPRVSDRLLLVRVPAIGISGTDIRERVARGVSIRYLVPQAVEQYIVEHRLYQPA